MTSLNSNPQQAIALPGSSDMDKRNRELFHQVFGIELLREKILSYAIHNDDGKFSEKNASSCRLVQHAWLESVSRCLKRTGEPLLKLALLDKRDLSPNAALMQFLRVYSCPSRAFDSIPPFSLTILCGDDVPPEGYRKVLEQYLRWCANGLVLLGLEFYEYDGQTLEIPKNLSLPLLRNIILRFSYIDSVDAIRTCGVQEILSACKKLKEVSLKGETSIPAILPGTVTNLDLVLSFGNLEEFVISNANKFAKFTALTLEMPPEPYTGIDSINRMLDLTSATLKILKIKDGYSDTDWPRTPIHFPVMKCLESCYVNADNWKWGEDRIIMWQNRLPAIKQLILRNLTSAMLQQLVENSRFETAEKVKFHVNTYDDNPNSNIDLPLALVQLPQAFPNISVLDVSLPIRNDTPTLLHPIFQGMSQLEVLCVSLDQDFNSRVVDPDDFWTIFFLGMSTGEVPSTNIPYITNLSELRVLKLSLEFGNIAVLIPDRVFDFGLLCMPKLRDLEVKGNFWQRWSAAGRRIHIDQDSSGGTVADEYSDQTEDPHFVF